MESIERAITSIKRYTATVHMQYNETETDILKAYDDFGAKFSPEVISGLEDAQLLHYLFLTADASNDSLCYHLEFDSTIKSYFGSISGGSSYKYGLFQRQDDQKWTSGAPVNPVLLSDTEALSLGKEIRDCLLKGCSIIMQSELSNLSDYEKMDDQLQVALGKYASYTWIQKYFHMIFHDKLCCFYAPDLQRHMLLGLGISPSTKYYARNGQLALVSKGCGLLPTFFQEVCLRVFGGIKHFIRLGSSDDTKNYASEWKNSGIVAIGWNGLGDLVDYLKNNAIDRNAVAAKLLETVYHNEGKTASRKAGEIKTFYEATINDVFVVMDGEKLISFVDQITPYYFDHTQPMAHCHKGTWHVSFTDDDKLPTTEGLMTACVEIKKEDNLLFLYERYYNFVNQRLDQSDESTIPDEGTEDNELPEMEMSEPPMQPRQNPLHPLNQIIYGAPGTGKTYSSAEYAMAIIENRPVNLSAQTREDRQLLMRQYTKYVNAGRIVFTTFHQSYGYEEFIQGIRPDPKAGTISFHKVDGIFKTIADTAKHHPNDNYVIIIDEINRGNISKIFGELITLIEEDKRCGELNQLTVTLPMGEKFTVPNNLYIIGTMNSADKSISLIDTALRRRFDFVEMAPNEALIVDSSLRTVMLSLNGYIRNELRSTDLLIGHAYFIGKTVDDLGSIMNNNIIPLLYEYFYDDEAKVRKALDCLSDTDFTIDSAYRGRIRIVKKG